MKKHIMSNYLKQIQMIAKASVDNTVQTESIESADPDEFRLFGSLTKHLGPDETFTHSTETSDADEFHIDSTTETRSIETSDPDGFRFLESTTYETSTIETSDADEFYDTTNTTFNIEQSDPDEFALV